MKKIFIGLLALAATTSIVLSCKSGSDSPKEMLIGKWQMDSVDISRVRDSTLGITALALIAKDSSAARLQFNFLPGGWLTEDNTGENTDSTRYQWEGTQTLVVFNNDSTSEKWSIRTLDSAQLVINSEDSVTFFLRRVKEK